MNSPEDEFPVEEPSNPALSEEESARQLRDDFCRQYRERIAELEKAFDSNKACLRRHFALLETLLEQFDHYADGAPDATDLGKFCNEMIGLYNEISMSDARTLRGQNTSMVAVIREMFDALERAKVGFHGAPPTENRIDSALALARPFLKKE